MPLPEVLGSGKFLMPCERTHDANLIPAAARFEALLLGLLGLLDDPQPAITSPPDTTATTIGTRWQARLSRPLTLTLLGPRRPGDSGLMIVPVMWRSDGSLTASHATAGVLGVGLRV